MSGYACSVCGAEAYHDGRMGDGPILMCGCDKRGSRWVNDGRGGYRTNPSGAEPVPTENLHASWDDPDAYDDGRH